MAITFQLVNATRNQLRYLCTQDGQAGTSAELPNTGSGSTPNFRTDAALFPLAKFPRAGIDGFPPLAAGTLTQAEIRAILAADDPTNAVLTNPLVPRCKAFVTPKADQFDWAVDAVSASSSPIGTDNPTYVVTSGAAAGVAYLDIVFQNTPER
jgi:hypothetical protein